MNNVMQFILYSPWFSPLGALVHQTGKSIILNRKINAASGKQHHFNENSGQARNCVFKTVLWNISIVLSSPVLLPPPGLKEEGRCSRHVDVQQDSLSS